jgi:hypothetical protein
MEGGAIVSSQVLSAGAGLATDLNGVGGLVDIVSGGFGAEHHAAAHAIADPLRRRGWFGQAILGFATSDAGRWQADQQGRPDVVDGVFAESRIRAA